MQENDENGLTLLTDGQGRPLLDQLSEEGFVDCTFRIANLRKTATTISFHMEASYADEAVGVDVSILRGIKAGLCEVDDEITINEAHIYRSGVSFSRSGAESDRLMAALAFLYGFDLKAPKMVAEENFTALAMSIEEVDIESQPAKIKIFGKDAATDDEDDYFESFFNIDIPNKLIFWNEKDPDYREPLLRALITFDEE